MYQRLKNHQELRFKDVSELINYPIARKRVAVIRQVIHEICGHKPYERKIMELLKQSKANTQKKAYKLAKKSLGTHKRALRKRNEVQEAVQRHEH